MKKYMFSALSSILAACLAFAAVGFYTAPQVQAQAEGKIELEFADYCSGTMSNADTAALSTVEKDGRRALKIVPNPDGTNYRSEICLDGWSYDTAEIDLSAYKYMSVEYFYEGKLPLSEDIKMTAGISTLGGALTSYYEAYSHNAIKSGSWESASFSLAVESLLSASSDTHFLKQLHLRVAKGVPAEAFAGNEAIYIGKITFYSYDPLFSIDYPHDIISLDFEEYYTGLIYGNATVTKTTLDGKNVLKVVPDTSSSSEVVLNGYRYLPAKIDLRKYKFAVITYYVDGTLPARDAKFTLSGTNNPFAKDEEGRYFYKKCFSGWMAAGSWQAATVWLDYEDYLDSDSDGYARELHLRICDGYSAAELSGINAIYINKLIFTTEETTPTYKICENYMQGYGDGTFRPNAPMTRAEASALLARLYAGSEAGVPTNLTSAFTDVDSSDWYGKYVAYLESLEGFISFEDGEFHPDREITEEEFAQLLVRLIMKKNGTEGGEAFYVADGSDAPITRAQAVVLTNNALGKIPAAEKIVQDTPRAFEDVERDHWAYDYICQAAIPHLEDEGVWVTSLTHPKITYGGDARADLEKGAAYIEELDAITAERIAEIRNTPTTVNVTGTKYYVSNSTGNDENDGKSPEKPWKTIAKVNEMQSSLKSGDGVFLKRGDEWRERLSATAEGITYSAYGEGEKPVLNGSPRNAADPSLWTLVNADMNIYRYAEPLIDVGSIFFNPESDNASWGYKEVPDWNTKYFFVRGTNFGTVFDYNKELNRDLEFFSEVKSMNIADNTGWLYLRCDKGNPGDVFDSIELAVHKSQITGSAHNRTFDNLCVKYGGAHGIGSGTTKNLTVTNCEFGWIGGCIQYYSGPSVDGVVRYGNGIQIYGTCDGFTVDNCYVYQCYDTGVTHQYNADEGAGNMYMNNITYSNNVIEDCIYSVEYWLNESPEEAEREGENFLVENNIMRRAGYGFGLTRPNGNESAHMKGASMNQKYKPGTFVVRNNIFDRSSAYMFQSLAKYPNWLPDYEGNTYVQVLNGTLGFYTGRRSFYYNTADLTIRDEYGDTRATVYFVGDEYKMTDPFA